MICDRPSEVRRFSISIPSGVVSPSGHQNCECALKLPVKKVAEGFSAWIFECKFLKFDKKAQNSGEVYLIEGLRHKTIVVYYPHLIISPINELTTFLYKTKRLSH